MLLESLGFQERLLWVLSYGEVLAFLRAWG